MPPDCLKCLESIKLHLSAEWKRDLQDLAMQEKCGVSVYSQGVLSIQVYGARDRLLRSRAADQAH